jgi:coatomer subunit beta'
MESLAASSYASGVHNVSFLSSFLLGDVQKCIEILVESERIPEASFFAQCYCPAQVPRLVALWREKSAQALSGIGKKAS